MKHLRKFNTASERTAFMQNTPLPVYPYVHYVADTKEVIYSDLEVDLPLYLECIDTLTFKFSNAYEYSLDGLTWEPATSSTNVSSTTPGERIYVRATGLTASSSAGIGRFTISSGNCSVGGNIMSMLYGAEYRGKTEITQTYAFYRMFYGNTRIKSARNLALPATSLTDYCYAYLFYNCSALVDAPALPATELAPYCYNYTFYNCSALVDAPALPATELAEFCYNSTFEGCRNLISAPALPAKILKGGCYYRMFATCSSLVNAPLIAATTLADTAKVGSTNYGCCGSMFSGCTNMVKAPTLRAEKLTSFCYYSMFKDCSKLAYIKAMYLTTDASSTGSWVSGVASEGVFVKNSAATWVDSFGSSAIPTGWTVELADA